ncbi:FemAB-related protein, PEP-CTERM system-associated [Nitrospira tepida]|uniref:FemAB-related protein, PEP-CTERM system-associated n=1 Tax=Nitrospira tepida TaxID=2973512 RepID=A0AA86T934_9BACT|nr:FemAB family XrtA/PEP-CTERM system-associated protein [Nitrospira tepida]CAI4032553.1 FemAB-related protein, PEP-CTERM system-associated [Nitrospira tepida]
MECRIENLDRDQAAGGLWDRYVLDSPTATGYHLAAWRQVIEQTCGHRTVYLMARDGHGEIRGVLPLVLLSSRLFGRFLVSMPFLNYGGVDAADRAVREKLLEAAAQEAKALGASHVEIRQAQPLPIAWRCKDHKVSMRLSLPSDFQTLFKSFPSKLRSQIRRPQKEGMTVKVGGADLLEDFYRVFSRNMRDLGTPVYGKGFFRTILETFPKETAVCSVSWNGHPVAAGLVYSFREMMEIPWASSDRRYDRLAPNMLLYSSVLEYACQQGCKVFDFGRSTLDSGTYRFKEQWGAKPVPLYWYYWLKDDRPLPELNPHNPRYRLAISLWRTLPLPIANLLGPRIVKYLP